MIWISKTSNTCFRFENDRLRQWRDGLDDVNPLAKDMLLGIIFTVSTFEDKEILRICDNASYRKGDEKKVSQ